MQSASPSVRQLALLAFTSFAMAMLGSMAPSAHGATTRAPPAIPASGAGGPLPDPPPEAIAACKGKAEGATVSFTGRQGESFSGVCQLANGVLAARPVGGRGAGGGGPPSAR